MPGPTRFQLANAIRVLRGKTERPTGTSWFQRCGEAIEGQGIFVGCPLEFFEWTSKDLFVVSVMQGLHPQSSVLEVGAGCLRTGYWFIRYLEPGRYCGIEPNRKMLQAGVDTLLPHGAASKQPSFHDNAAFDFTVFERTFDFVVAYSVWSHSSKRQIERMLDQFRGVASPGSKFITSWRPARDRDDDYLGQDWVGRSHDSDKPGMVAHSREWLRHEVTSRGLQFESVDDFTTLDQEWLVVTYPN